MIVVHDIIFTPYPTTSNRIVARCTCGWSAFGPSLEVQGKAACHDLDIESPSPFIEGTIIDAYNAKYRNKP